MGEAALFLGLAMDSSITPPPHFCCQHTSPGHQVSAARAL